MPNKVICLNSHGCHQLRTVCTATQLVACLLLAMQEPPTTECLTVRSLSQHPACSAMQDNLHFVENKEKDSVDMAAANFLEFLKEGRSVILQDAAILQDQYPGHRLFKLPCFRLAAEGCRPSPLQQAWAAYKAEVLAAHARSTADNLEVIST